MHGIVNYIQGYLDSNQTPGSAGNFFWATVYILLVFAGLSIAVIAMNWLERKILAHMQVRLGPMRVGPHGLLQPIADALKLLLKEDIIPAEADKTVFWVAPFIVVLAAFTVFVVVPFGPTHAITDMNIGILFMLGVSSLSALGIRARIPAMISRLMPLPMPYSSICSPIHIRKMVPAVMVMIMVSQKFHWL